MKNRAPAVRVRSPQKRAEQTRARLLNAGIKAFSTAGYEGTSILALEKAARTKRGVLVYHFGSKEGFWRAVADELGRRIEDALVRALESREASGDRLERAVYAFIQANVRTPEMMRILIRESEPLSARTRYLLDRNVRTFIAGMQGLLGRELSIHDYYLFVGASAFAIASPSEARHIWGVDPLSEPFISDHARIVTAFLRPLWQPQSKTAPSMLRKVRE